MPCMYPQSYVTVLCHVYIFRVYKREDSGVTAQMDPTILLTTSWVLALQSTSRQGLPGPLLPPAKITPPEQLQLLTYLRRPRFGKRTYSANRANKGMNFHMSASLLFEPAICFGTISQCFSFLALTV